MAGHPETGSGLAAVSIIEDTTFRVVRTVWGSCQPTHGGYSVKLGNSMLCRALLALSLAVPLSAQGLPVPRKAPEFVIHSIDGQKVPLSAYSGRVVSLNFIHTTCPHCQQLSAVMNQLYAEFGPQGFLPVAIAWNDSAESLAAQFAKAYRLAYPVGYSDRSTVLGFLGIALMDQRTVVPQMVWIDRKGIVRAQTPSIGDENMMTEPYYRQMITTLLAEPPPARRSAANPK
jgi:peroxiredoxin